MNVVLPFEPINVQIPDSVPARVAGEQGEDFVGVLKGAIGHAESLHDEAQQQITSLLAGNGAELHSAAIAVEKADISFQLMMQVRNKIVAAYQEVAHMQF